jgi:hypothetical protein
MDATCGCLDSPDSPCACPRDNTTNTPCT